MKNIAFLFSIFVFFFAASCSEQTEKTSKNTEVEEDPINILNPYTENGVDSNIVEKMGHLSFADTVHDFGNLKEGEIVEWEVEYTNTGKGEAIIQYASSTCGCTVPEYSREPIPSGKTEKLKIKFDSTEKHGHVEKVVTIETNAFPSIYKLKITANVI